MFGKTAAADMLIAAGADTDTTDNVSTCTCVSSDTDMLCC